ncbi:MAG: fluoride efflux transporter CrcB [Succinivibrio sp.]|nr:fluoride efflux transporter CrcB [Succinivibrio sp.]
MFINMLCVGFGGFIGAVLRALTGICISKLPALASFPFATLIVNITGSFFIGILLTLPQVTANPNLKAFLTAGLLGGLTTFSTFTFDTLSLIEHRMFVSALLNVFISVSVALFACYIGTLLSKHVF